MQTKTFIPQLADVNWQIASTADFNGDSTPDILWHNVKTGENVIWQMNGFALQSKVFLDRVADK